MIHFFYQSKMFSGGIEMEHWAKMGQQKKHKINVLDELKVNNKDTKTTSIIQKPSQLICSALLWFAMTDVCLVPCLINFKHASDELFVIFFMGNGLKELEVNNVSLN